MIQYDELQLLDRERMSIIENSKFMKTIFSIAEKYQLFTKDDIEILTSVEKCKEVFKPSSWAALIDITNLAESDIRTLIYRGKNVPRYYRYPEYCFGGKKYIATNDMYGKCILGEEQSKDNRTPLYDWFMERVRNFQNSNRNIQEIVNDILKYIASKGFTYDSTIIENFILSLQSKPFVILAGISGTGKTRLVKLFAEAIDASYHLIPVRPDWSDGSDLFGHYDLNGKFIRGSICDSFDEAYANPDKPVFVCLDEMNLARVEYYFSDVLSVIESREKDSYGHISTSGIAQYDKGIPDNLYIVGTVNMDETTFPFSKKVLDRANTIEFNYVDLLPEFSEESDSETEPLQVSNSALKSKYLVLAKDCIEEKDYVQKICAELQTINQILMKANAHVGYRVRDEIVFYMLNNKNAENLLSEEESFDNEIMQKILPRIQGSSVAVRDMLCELFKICAADHEQKTGDSDSEKMKKVLDDAAVTCKYRHSAEKLELMVRRFEEDGFTSYWL